MKKILIGVLITITLQILFVSGVIIYKGEKSYYTYYSFISKFPNNFTKNYLDTSILRSDLDEAIRLLKRQKKLIYSNSNKIMISDLLNNTYKVHEIINSNLDRKKFIVWLEELKSFLGNGYGDYYLDYIYFKTKYPISDEKDKELIFKNIQKLNYSNFRIYKHPIEYFFLKNEINKINKICKEYNESQTINLPFTSKYSLNNQKFASESAHTKIYLNDKKEKFVIKKFLINQNEKIILDENLIDQKIEKITLSSFFQSGVNLKFEKITLIDKNNNLIDLKESDYLITAKYGFFDDNNNYFGNNNLNREFINIFLQNNKFEIHKIVISLKIIKLNPTSINCNDKNIIK